jgi:iron complex outermembrane receptor protein
MAQRTYVILATCGVLVSLPLIREATAADQDTMTLPQVSVQAAPTDPDPMHSEAQQIDMGPLGTTSIQDTPYTVNVVPQALIQDQQLESVQDAFRYLPSVQGDGARPQTRGFQGSVVQNSRMDGFNIISTTDYPIEQFDHIEVLDGLSGAIYGPTNPAGTFNYVSKRPTDAPYASFRAAFETGGGWIRSADVSDRVGAVGFRLNLLDEDGNDYVSHSELRRQLASMALDFHIDDDTVLQTNLSFYHFITEGLPPTFALAPGVSFPKNLNPSSSAYGQTWAGNNDVTQTGSVKLIHNFNDNWHLTAGVLQQYADREGTGVTDTFTNNQGAYVTTLQTTTASRFTITSNLVHLNGTFQTGPFSHDLTIGTTGFNWQNFNPVSGATYTLGTASLANPAVFAEPMMDFADRYRSAVAFQQSFIVSDTIKLTPRWSVMLTGSESWLSSQNYNVHDIETSQSSNRGFSPAASVIYRILPQLNAYATYASSLQQGDTAPAGTVNQNSILAPFRSTQYETGLKLALSKLSMTIAAFQITRPIDFINTTTDVYAVGGDQRNRGVDFTLNGEILPGLAAFGGFEYLDPEVLNTGTPSTSNKQIVGLSRFVASLLLRWQVAHVPGLTLDTFVRRVGNRPTDDADQFYASGYTTLDLGAAYTIPIEHETVTFRFDARNITNASYLTNIVPGGLNGYTGAGNASAELGMPRSVELSAQVVF